MAVGEANLASMPPIAQADELRLKRGSLVLELTLRPFTITVRRDGRRLLRAVGAWVAEGTIADRFIHLTEGVVPHEDRSPAERAVIAEVQDAAEDWLRLGLILHGGRRATLGIELQPALVTFELEAEGDPLRLALDWDRRSEERITGLGLRHATTLDQVGREIQLGADRAYTGPDCPAEMRDDGGIPQGDCAPAPWPSPAAATPCGSRPTPTGRASIWPASGSRSRRERSPGPCGCTCSAGRHR